MSDQPDNANPNRHDGLAFGLAVPIGLLGGLIGLGGAEFRLPVLAGPLGYEPRRAVPLNLTISLITLIASLAIRGRTLSLAPLVPFGYAILAMACGAIVAAFYGVAWSSRLTDRRLEQVILALLLGIGLALVVESFLPQQAPGFVPGDIAWQAGAGVAFGMAIGLVSSLLGVAGGELIIPTLIFGFGADVRTAGTASLLISLPAVLVGVIRFTQRGALSDHRAVRATVVPMGAGSILGAIIGGLLVGVLPTALLKLTLGLVLIVSALRIFNRGRSNA
jgi:uncharacterized membrane protein YfcA